MAWSGPVSTSKGPLQNTLAPPSELTRGRESTSQALRNDYVTTQRGLGEKTQECIVKCLDCRSVCMRVADHYMGLKTVISESPDVRPLLNCADICATAARFMLRGSEFSRELCLFCAEVCNSCAGQFSGVRDAAEIKACVAACRQCAECCERMAGVATAVVEWPLTVRLANTEPGRG